MIKKYLIHLKKTSIVTVIVLTLFACVCFLDSSDNPPKIKIMASIFPLMEFAKAVSADRGDVQLLLPPGAEVHTWSPRPSDILKLSNADLFIYVGSDLEPWVHDILKSIKNPDLKVMEASQGLSIIKKEADLEHHEAEHENEEMDPHIWLDFENDQKIVRAISLLLSELDPANAHIFKKNASAYIDKLEILDKEFMNAFKNCSQRILVLGGHAAFGYLARRYNLRQISLYGLNPDSKPSPRKLIEIVELIKNYKIKSIFFEVSVSDELARVIAKEVGAQTLVLNPGANLTKKQLEAGISFFDIMKRNLENLKNGLSCY